MFYLNRVCLRPFGQPRSNVPFTDIVAYSASLASPEPRPSPHWSSLEIAVEYKSTKKNGEQHIKQAASYVAYLLSVRPNLISTLGLLVSSDDLVFLICKSPRYQETPTQRPGWL